MENPHPVTKNLAPRDFKALCGPAKPYTDDQYIKITRRAYLRTARYGRINAGGGTMQVEDTDYTNEELKLERTQQWIRTQST